MKQKLLFIFLFYSFLMQSQCFDCAKNFGGWNGDVATDLKRARDGIYLAKNGGNFGDWFSIYKYDFNCNLIWEKEFDERSLSLSKLAIDNQDNTYVLITWPDAHNAIGPFPKIFSGLPIYPGLNLIKFDKNGNFIWNRSIGNGADYGMRNVFIHDDIIYITGTFYDSITINNEITLKNTVYTGYYIYHPLLFIAKFDLNGNLKKAEKFGTSNDEYTSSEMDKNGDLYFARYSYVNSNYTHSDIDKIDTSLNVVWSKEISNNKVQKESFFRPTLLHYNPNNDKLYLWGAFYKFADILGTIYTAPTNTSNFTQSILSEFNVSNGTLERAKQINNSSTLDIPGMNGSSSGNTAYLAEKGNELYIFSSFTGTMTFPNATIQSRTYMSGTATYNDEDLLLFKVDLNSFESEFILKSTGTNYYSQGMSTDAANPILFNGNDLYLTASFESSPLIFNGSVIKNNSGNNASDVMLYKYKLDPSIASGEIIAENTCLNTPANFEVKGTFDSILWNFDDPNSTTNNSATINNPQHKFSAEGVYNVTALIHCGSESQTLKKEITITKSPNDFALNSIYSCEANSGSGISNSFDTSGIQATVIGNQSDLIVEYTNQNGVSLPSPLPNPYTNTVKNQEIITVKSYFKTNPTCYIEKDFKLITISKPESPAGNSPQTFCIQQNATLDDIQISGQDLKWYDSDNGGSLLPKNTSLQNEKKYYATQTLNDCESARTAILIYVQDTAIPTGNSNQQFCTGENSTINNIEITGNLIKWYDASANGSLLAETTILENNKTYYASQTKNNCEGPRLGVTIALVNTPSVPSANPEQSFCRKEKKTLNDIQINGQNIKWFDTSFSAAALPNTTLLENDRTYYASQIIGCESDRTPVLIHVYDTQLPTGNSNQQFCIDEIATLENLNITGRALKWYNAAINGTILPETTLLESKIYYVTQTLNNCESERYAITVKVQDTQNPNANSLQQFCIQKSAKISDIEIIGQSIKWYDSSLSSITLSESTLLENGITYYASQTISNCESDKIPVTINILEATDRECINLTTELPFPKFFTPNGDGFNDLWTIDAAYLAPNSSIKIFNRYGKLLKDLSLNTSWDGTYIGQLQPASDYWFTAIKLNGTEFRGHFTLKR